MKKFGITLQPRLNIKNVILILYFISDETEGPYTFKSIDDILKNPIFREQAHLIMNTNYENHPLVEFI